MLCIKRVSHLLHITMIKFFKFGFLIRSSANINIYKIQMSPYYDCLIPSSSPSISARIAPVILRCFAWDRAHSFVSPLNVIFLHTRMKYSFLVFIDCTRVLCAHCNNLCFLVFFELRPRARASAESGRSNRSACICKRTANSKSNASFAFARLRFERECEQNGHRTAGIQRTAKDFFYDSKEIYYRRLLLVFCLVAVEIYAFDIEWGFYHLLILCFFVLFFLYMFLLAFLLFQQIYGMI